jgi:penicillin-binding protein 1A
MGDKETGARTALPIWMTWMRAAISDKIDEKFLGDETGNPALKAAAAPSAKPRLVGLPARPVKANALANLHVPARPASTGTAVRPAFASPVTGSPTSSRTTAASSGTAARPPAQTAAQPVASAPTTRSAPAIRSRIRPALIPESVAAKPAGAVKPVIAPSASLGEPAKPHVKTALTPQLAPAQQKVAVKPALNSNPLKPKDQR